jgi:hypothetical protein
LPCAPVAYRRQYLFHKRDPRRYQVLVDYLVEEFHSTDYNGESSLNAVKALCFFRAFYEEQNWKFSPWVDEAVDRVWAEISSEHDEASYMPVPKECLVDPSYCLKVRAYISELLAFASKIKVSKPSYVRTLCSRSNSANRSLRFLQPKSSCVNAGPRPSTSIYWGCEAFTIGHVYKN